ncbi:MAG: guanylate kinase [Lachnospiraceae bacterium]|nr:guanylate kinase [Lachnospiraceae bacterium]
MKEQGSLIVVSGFSGAGKGTLMKNLLRRGDRYALSVSMTTRSPRPGEADGKDYYFVSTEKFEETIKAGGLLEYAKYCDHYYGTPKQAVLSRMAEGKDVLLEIDVQGGRQIKKIFPETVLVFIVTPDAKTLLERLRGRGSESEDVIHSRIARAADESRIIPDYDYVLVNEEGDLDACTDRLEDIICASHFRTGSNRELIESLDRGLHELI